MTADRRPDADGAGRSDGLPEDEQPPEFGLERVVFFSDAVFAIAITLLVIDLRPPEVIAGLTDDAYLRQLGELGPKIFAYLLSFFVIGLYWLAHWRRFHYVVRADERLALLNLLLLGCVSFIPFPTALMGEQGDRAFVVVIYALTLSAAGVLGSLCWEYAARTGATRPGLTRDFIRFGTLRGLSVPLVMLPSLVALPILGPQLVELSWVLIFVVQAVIVRRFRPPGAAIGSARSTGRPAGDG